MSDEAPDNVLVDELTDLLAERYAPDMDTARALFVLGAKLAVPLVLDVNEASEYRLRFVMVNALGVQTEVALSLTATLRAR